MKKQKEAETAQIIELHEERNTQYLKQVYNIGIYSYLRCELSNGSHPTPKWFNFSSAQVCKNFFGQFCKKIFRDKKDLQSPFVYSLNAPTSFYCYLVQKLTEL